MARPQSHTMTVGRAAGDRPKPWYVRWRKTDVTGDRRPVTKWFAREADAIAFQAKHAAHAAALPPPPPPVDPPPAAGDLAGDPGTFQAFAEQWRTTIAARRAESTQRSYASLLRTHVYPIIGARPLAAIDVEAVILVITMAANAGASWGTQKLIVRVLSTCCRWAVRFKHLPTNPCVHLIKELRDDSTGDCDEPEPHPLSADQAFALLEWIRTGVVVGAAGDRPVDGRRNRYGRVLEPGYPDLYPYFLALVETGMRRGEAAALKWSSVYLEAAQPYLRIERSDSPSARAVGKPGDVVPKNKRYRDVPIAPALLPELVELARTRKARAFAAGRPVSPYVFVTARGQRVLANSSMAPKAFQRGLAALGLEAGGYSMHALRDTFATLHLMANPGHLARVSVMLGHRHVSTTLNRYIRWVPSMATDPLAGLMPVPTPATHEGMIR